ncbi:protein phosphatase 2C domain-containing protein [Streptomyces sp. ADI98-10]|uniref:protein phosphatase 2C domain-containing protein n=1 Tax=Streptomyces sp. ADI98-10 TaxID=1522763 RepID=UPI000F54F886|nr:protein phosphatase 2C domain-containing protein [Streptomyces sp. ADI98-10]
MSQQGEKPAAHEDDWWRKLYDETAQDTGPSTAADSLDDRFDSVSNTVSTSVDDLRDTVRETVRDPYASAYEDPFEDRYEEPDADRDEDRDADPYAGAYRPPERSRSVVAQRGPDRVSDRGPDPVPDEGSAVAPAPAAAPEPGLAEAMGPVPAPGPDPAPAADPDPDPGQAVGLGPVQAAAPAPGPDPVPPAGSDPAPEHMPDPRSAWDLYVKRDPETELEPGPAASAVPVPVPEPEPVPGPGPGPGPTAGPDRAVGPAPAATPVPAAGPAPTAGPGRAVGPAPTAGPGRAVGPAPTAGPDRAAGPAPTAGPGRAVGPAPIAGADRAVGPAPDAGPASVATPVPAATLVPPSPPPVSPPSAPLASPPAPRTPVFPAPWEAPAGQPGPRTFAAPRAPERPEPALAPGPSALHGPPPDLAADGRPAVGHLGDRPPTYDAEPAALPSATSENLEGLVPDTVLDGARYGTYTLRSASVRGDSARFRGEPRRDGLLTARFGAAESALVLVAVAGGRRAGEAAHLAAADACRWIGGAVARSHVRLSEDIRAGRRGDLKSGLHRLTDRTYGKLRARAAELGVEPDAYTANLRCLLLPADPDCRTRVFFGGGSGGLFRLRDGLWQDLEPVIPESGNPQQGDEREEGPDGDRLTTDLQITAAPSPSAEGPARPPAEPFRFRASVARPGDTLMLCSDGLAEPMRGEPALPGELAERWGSSGPPGLPAFLADTQLRIKGYADDRTCAAVWEA